MSHKKQGPPRARPTPRRRPGAKEQIRVYIAGPMSSSGEPGPNVHAAATAAADLLTAGHFPFVPHVTWFLHMVRPDVDVALWQAWDLEWLGACDVLLRIPGVSRGADAEVERAHELGIPVYTSLESLFAGMSKDRSE